MSQELGNSKHSNTVVNQLVSRFSIQYWHLTCDIKRKKAFNIALNYLVSDYPDVHIRNSHRQQTQPAYIAKK